MSNVMFFKINSLTSGSSPSIIRSRWKSRPLDEFINEINVTFFFWPWLKYLKFKKIERMKNKRRLVCTCYDLLTCPSLCLDHLFLFCVPFFIGIYFRRN